MRTFDYITAWNELPKKDILTIPDCVKVLLNKLNNEWSHFQQNSSLRVSHPTAEVDELLKVCEPEDLGKAAQIVYCYGHWAPTKADKPVAIQGGSYWKCSSIIEDTLIRREEQHAILKSYPADTDKYHISERLFKERHNGEGRPAVPPANELDYIRDRLREELPAPDGFELLGLEGINHRTKDGKVKHPFVIGDKHFPKDGGMYINPHQAPCAESGYNYDDFIHDTVAVIYVKGKDDASRNEAVISNKAWVESIGDKINKEWGLMNTMGNPLLDGFMFAKSKKRRE